jgi:ACS family glucarate transporter-like MFS transporter
MNNTSVALPKLETASDSRNATRRSKVRRNVFALSVVVMAVSSLDRVNLSIAGKSIQDQFGLSTEALGWLFSAFFLGYAIFQVPAGYAADRYGPRGVLAIAILWWSVFTMAVGLAPHLALGSWLTVAWSIAIMRFLVGVGEAAGPPALTRIAALWANEGHRAAGTSFMSAGLGLGGIFGPIFVVWSMQRWGWPSSFYLCGIIGLVVGLAWWRYVRNRPEQVSQVESAEAAPINRNADNTFERRRPDPTPWKKMFSSPTVWALLVSYAFQNYVYYVYYDWLYIYLVRVRGLTMTKGGLWASTPFIAITLLALLGGRLSDWAVRRFGRRRGRQSAVWLAGVCSLVLLLTATHIPNNLIAIPLLAAAAGFNFFPVPTFYAACIDLMPDHSASLAASMNSFAHFAAWLSPIITARIITRFGWTGAFNWAAIVTVVPGLIWFFVNADKRLEPMEVATR